ncbi:hypothetical protein [Rhizobium nepotum]|jgi:hypothetical protein|uniref:Transcriptional regulator n=1 Tax=Rhizobium nepotum 39/7 TaxID=1368418 RepID=A0ABR5CLB4_9HYPH|nr:hypothetical protein [Rhizobium nepotum]KJF65653.1 hypothetical protein RS75_22080 [Rhizobium nepotum 39/7]
MIEPTNTPFSIKMFDTLYHLESANTSVVSPEESDSGAWEVLDLSKEKFMELHTDQSFSSEQFSQLLGAMEIAFNLGLREGREECQTAAISLLQSFDDEVIVTVLNNLAAENEDEEAAPDEV